MNSKRSYLDTLNAGRQRRPHSTLDQLNRSLEELEQRIGRSRTEMPFEAPRAAPRPTQSARNIFEEERLRQRRPAANPRSDSAYHSLAHDIDRVRAQENGVAEFGKIASELKGLREELRNQLTSGVKREFDTLRKEMAHAYSGGVSMKDRSELSTEFERLSGAIANLSERSDDKSIGLLRLEVEQVRNALSTLAREETLRSVDQRWDDFDRRWTDFESRVTAPASPASDPAIEALTERLEHISAAVNNLPESLSLRTLEEKVRTLSGAVDHFVGQEANRGSDTFNLIEERLDEISRAILASSVAAQIPNFDPEPFQRIEARIGSLALQIEEVAGRQAPQALDAEPIFRGIEQRFDILSDVIERRQGDAMEQSSVLFRDLERRLEDVADRLDRNNAEKVARQFQHHGCNRCPLRSTCNAP
jgi:localization factor PodJL